MITLSASDPEVIAEMQSIRKLYALKKVMRYQSIREDRELKLFKQLGIGKDVAVANKCLATESYPYMQRFLDAWTARAVSLDVFPE